VSVQKVSLCLFYWKPKSSGASLESPGLENMPQLITYWHVRISTYCILYFVYAYLSRIAHYVNVESSHIHAVCMNKQNKPIRQHTTSLKSPGLKNIPQLTGNRAEVGQNHDLRKVVSSTLSVLK